MAAVLAQLTLMHSCTHHVDAGYVVYVAYRLEPKTALSHSVKLSRQRDSESSSVVLASANNDPIPEEGEDNVGEVSYARNNRAHKYSMKLHLMAQYNIQLSTLNVIRQSYVISFLLVLCSCDEFMITLVCVLLGNGALR